MSTAERLRERHRVGVGLMVLATSGTALGLGGAHTAVLFAGAAVALFGVGVLISTQRLAAVPLPSRIALVLSLYCLVQAGPLPDWLLAVLSPHAADVWARALYPFGETLHWGSLSLDPGGSAREALKWAMYGWVFWGAKVVADRYGRHACVLVVFVSALAVAVATLVHGLLGATLVYGIYEPTFDPARWHVGPLLNPNNLSGYLNLGAFAGLGLVFSRRYADRRWLVAVGVALLFGVSVLSGSRGGVWLIPLGIVGFSVLLAVSRRRHRRPSSWERRTASWLAICLGLVFAGAGATQATWEQLFQDNFSKLELARWIAPMLRDYPVFGVGRGAFETAFTAYAPASGNSVFSHAENFVLQWLAEWGVVGGGIALVLFARAFRPARLDAMSSPAGIGALVGVVLVLLQNLVDLGLELAGVALAVTWLLASLWRSEEVKTPAAGAASGRVHALAIAGTSIPLWLLAVSNGGADPSLQRREIHASFAALDPKDPKQVEIFRSALRDRMSSLPAEPYFARMGAALALKTRDAEPMRWLQRALERGPNDARTHLIAAEVLARRGARLQALFELRRTVELDAKLTSEVGTFAAAWAKEPEDIERAAPADARGGLVLVAAARQLKTADAREKTLRAALRRDPASVLALRELGRQLARNIELGSCDPNAECAAEALERARALGAVEPDSAEPLSLEAHILRMLGRPSDAAVLLERRCPTLNDVEYVRCLMTRLDVARRQPNVTPGELSELGAKAAREACRHLASCAATLLSIGDTLRDAGILPEALTTYEQAVQQEMTVGSLMRVADIALTLGRFSQADAALARAASITAPSSEEGTRIREKREALRRAMLIRTAGAGQAAPTASP